jgi:hypothetical protein
MAVFGLLSARVAELEAAAKAAKGVAGPPEPVYQPCALLTVPLFHATATHAVFLPAFYSASKIVIMYVLGGWAALGLAPPPCVRLSAW